MSARIASAFNSNSTVIKVHDSTGEVRLVEATANLMAPHSLANYWHGRDLWVERSIAYGMSKIVTSDMLVTAEESKRSDFYGEWLKPLDIHHMIGAVFPLTDGVAVLGIHRPEASGLYEAQDRARLSALLPHLQRSVQISARLGAQEREKRWSLQAIDAIDAGLIVLDARCRIVRMNSVAEAIVAANGEIGATGGRLWLADPSRNMRLTALVADCIAIAQGRAAPLPKAILVERPDRLAITITAAPLDCRGDALTGDRWHALLFMRDPEHPPVRIEQLRALFGLTRREAIIAAKIAAGHSLATIAATLRVGIETVRSHLKEVFAKTGTSRQAELVALISRSVAFLDT